MRCGFKVFRIKVTLMWYHFFLAEFWWSSTQEKIFSHFEKPVVKLGSNLESNSIMVQVWTSSCLDLDPTIIPPLVCVYMMVDKTNKKSKHKWILLAKSIMMVDPRSFHSSMGPRYEVTKWPNNGTTFHKDILFKV